MKIIKEGKLKEAQKVSFSSLVDIYPDSADDIQDVGESFDEVYNVASARIFNDLFAQIEQVLNYSAACLITGDDKYKVALEKLNKEIQDGAKGVVDAAKKADKATTSAIKFFDKLAKQK